MPSIGKGSKSEGLILLSCFVTYNCHNSKTIDNILVLYPCALPMLAKAGDLVYVA